MVSLEEVPRENELAVCNILEHVKLGTIHIEPVSEKYPRSIRDLLGRLDHWKWTIWPGSIRRYGG
jgi:hypothetical protein